MKKSLSLVLALVMILGSFSTVFAAEATAVEKAGEFLNEKGILSGYAGSKDLGLEDNLLRQDTLVLVAKLLGEFDEAKAHKGEVTYEDVNDKTYVPLAAWAKENNTFVGHSDAKFGFGENLKAQEYAKVLLTALGYKVAPNGDSDIKWADALAKAKEFGILADVKVENATEITRGEMAVMTFNALEVTMKDSKETLADKLGIEMPAAEKLEAKVLDTENLAEIVIELSNSKLVKNKEALTNPANYRLNDTDVKVSNVEVDGNNVILTLVPYGKVEDQTSFKSLIKGKKYNLTIRNIDNAINKEYKGIVAGDNEIPVVENIEFMGTHGIKVTTSEPIANLAERNFRLDSRTAMIVEQYGRDIILTPYHGKEFAKETVELTIDQLDDFANYRSVKTVKEMAISTDEALPTVKEAYRSGNKLVVEFDKDVYQDSIKAYESRRELGNVSFAERRVEFYAETAKKVNTNVVEYTFSRDIPKSMEIQIEGVKNHFNKAMDKETIVPSEYKDDYAPVVISSTAKVEITEAEDLALPANATTLKNLLNKTGGHTVETQEMTIVFDKDIEEFKTLKTSDIKVEDYFTLYELDITKRGEIAASDVEIKVVEVKKDRIELSFENIKMNNKDRDYDYILEVKNFSDINRNRMERDYLDFQVVRVGTTFDVTNIKVNNTRYFNRDGAEIVLEFNDYVSKEEASNAKNYYLDGKLKVSEAIVEKDGKTVSLVVYDTTATKLVNDYKVLEISPRVTLLDDSAVTVARRFWDLKTRTAITAPAGTTGSAVTFMDGIVPLTEEELKGYEVLQNTSSSAMVMNMEYVGEINDVATATLLDKDGKVVAMDRKVVSTGTALQLSINVPVNKATTYTLRVEAKGNVYNLPIKVLGTSTDIFVGYDNEDITVVATSAGKDLLAGEKFIERKLNIKLADGVVGKVLVNKLQTTTIGQNKYQVIVTPESGVAKIHTVIINEVPAV